LGVADHPTIPPWAIVLAGGRSPLRRTLDRIRPRIPVARTVVVTHVRDAEYVAHEFANREAPECLLQPEDRGTAAAILWAAHIIRQREPGAVAVVFPCDHYVDGEPEFMGHVLDVVAFVRRRGERLVLIGAPPIEAETQYGWIEPGEPVGGIHGRAVYGIRRICENPSPDAARALHDAGAFWNTFIVVSSVETLAAVGAATVSELNAQLARLAAFGDTPEALWEVRQTFALAPSASFSGDMLERLPLALAVSPLPTRVVWADWSTRERVVASLHRAGLTPRLLEDLGSSHCS
jgi:mannose-1-phosphate guanylyltransferase